MDWMYDAMQRISARNGELAEIIGGYNGLVFALDVRLRHGMAIDDIVRDLMVLKKHADKVVGGRE